MVIKYEVQDHAARINLEVHDRLWGMSIKRADGAQDPRFVELADGDKSELDNLQLIPNIATLNFSEPIRHGLGIELTARDNDYVVGLHFPNNQLFTADGVLADFREVFRSGK